MATLQQYKDSIIDSLIANGNYTRDELSNPLAAINSLLQACAEVTRLYEISIANISSSVNTQTTSFFGRTYLANKILAYEASKELVLSDFTTEPVYETTNLADRLVSNVSIDVNSDSSLSIKLVKLDGENLTNLTDTELSALQVYVENIILLGTQFVLTSGPANVLQFLLTVQIDNITLIESNGEVITVADGQEVLNGYIQEYINSFNLSSFNSTFKLVGLIDFLQTKQGILDVYIEDNMLTRYVANVATTQTRNIDSTTGYWRVIFPDDDDSQSLVYNIIS